jgi:hypothetical protein
MPAEGNPFFSFFRRTELENIFHAAVAIAQCVKNELLRGFLFTIRLGEKKRSSC